jgi:hypothetical protein
MPKDKFHIFAIDAFGFHLAFIRLWFITSGELWRLKFGLSPLSPSPKSPPTRGGEVF